MTPRHHCRFCGRSVCGNCSPSSVYLEGQNAPWRACNLCASTIPTAHKVKDRLRRIAGLGGNASAGVALVSDVFRQNELSLTQQGCACMLSNVLFVMAADMTREAGSTLVDGLFRDVKESPLLGGDKDLDECNICKTSLGYCRMNPKHHCRFCGSSVCSYCSPSSVHIAGQKGTHRACNTCATIIPAARKVKNRLNSNAGRLRSFSSPPSSFTSLPGKSLAAIDEAARMFPGDGVPRASSLAPLHQIGTPRQPTESAEQEAHPRVGKNSPRRRGKYFE